jgi:hypothetical protein
MNKSKFWKRKQIQIQYTSHLKKLQSRLEKRHSDVGVQKMEILSVDPVINKTTLDDEDDTIP